jgi:hypothetical protein
LFCMHACHFILMSIHATMATQKGRMRTASNAVLVPASKGLMGPSFLVPHSI